MKKRLVAVLVSAMMLIGMVTGCGSSSDKTAKSGVMKVVLITMDSTDQHWVTLNKSAEETAKELGNVEYKWMAPDKKDDVQQIEQISNAVVDGADAIMIAANGPDSISAALEDAKSQGIRIVYVDAVANVEADATFITNGVRAGEIAGEKMQEALQESGRESGSIGIVNFSVSNQNAINRESGFKKSFEGTDYKILETQYSEGDAAKSQDMADNFITEGVVGIFGVNEGCTVGVGNAIKGFGTGIVGVGFDQSDAILSLVKDGSIYCTIAQNPDVMGAEGMKAAVAAIKGEEIKNTNVDTGVTVITRDGSEKQ